MARAKPEILPYRPGPPPFFLWEKTVGELPEKNRFPLKFLHVSDQVDLQDLIQGPNNRERLLEVLRRRVRDLFLAVSLPPDPPALANDLAYRIGEITFEAVVEKLSRYFPNDIRKDGPTLLRWHVEQAGVFLEQVCSYLVDILMEDFIKRPSDHLAARCLRVLPVLGRWPKEDMRDRPQHGNASQLWYLWIYEVAQNLLKSLPRGPVTIESRNQRKELLKNVFIELPDVIGRKSTHIRHPESGEIWLEASEQDIDRWSKLSRHKIALEITAKVIQRTRVDLTPSYLHRILPELRAYRLRIEKAWAALQKSK